MHTILTATAYNALLAACIKTTYINAILMGTID